MWGIRELQKTKHAFFNLFVLNIKWSVARNVGNMIDLSRISIRRVSSWVVFLNHHNKHLLEHGMRLSEATKVLAARWNRMTDLQKAKWEKKADKCTEVKRKKVIAGEIMEKLRPPRRNVPLENKISPFNCFTRIQYPKVKKANRGMPQKWFFREIGALWRNLPQQARMRYARKAEKVKRHIIDEKKKKAE